MQSLLQNVVAKSVRIAGEINYAVNAKVILSRQYNIASSTAKMLSPICKGTVNRPIRTRIILQQVRCMGVTEKLMNIASSSIEGNKEKKFQEMLNMMIASPKWTLRNWKTTMTGQLDSWTMYIPGVSNSNEIKELKGFKTMLDAMSSEELDNPGLIKGPQRERIAQSTGKPVDEVQRLLFFYKQSVVIATWLQIKKAAKEKMPTTEAELHLMQSTDPRMKTIAGQVMKGDSKHARTGRGRKIPF